MKLVQRMLLIATVVFSCAGCDQATKTLARQSLANSASIAFLSDIFRLLKQPTSFFDSLRRSHKAV